jgi:hypothetical protein
VCYSLGFLSLFCREAYEQLQREKEQEVVMLKEQNQRLQVQLNNTQVSLHDLKERSSQHIQELESHVSLLERKVIFCSVKLRNDKVILSCSQVRSLFIASYVM